MHTIFPSASLEELRYVHKSLLAHEKVEEPLVLRSEIASAVRGEGWALDFVRH
jgi:hypothetical protein